MLAGRSFSKGVYLAALLLSSSVVSLTASFCNSREQNAIFTIKIGQFPKLYWRRNN
jgi:hypothetical protein